MTLRLISQGFTQRPVWTVVLVTGVKKPNDWHVGTSAGQSAFVSQGAVQYCAWPMITVKP